MQPDASYPQSTFDRLPLRPELLKSLASLEYVAMTPIQAQTLPIILNQGDVLAGAKTGSGKTAAFGLIWVRMSGTKLRKNKSYSSIIYS